MGLLIEGIWDESWYNTTRTGGRFVRKPSVFRHQITADGASGFAAEPDRYHLYVAMACPWAHRTLIYRKLKGLEQMIPVSVVDPCMGEQGWSFSGEGYSDAVNGASRLHQIYTLADPRYSGRVTVPVLWDTHQQTIVSNESVDIIRSFNRAFDGLTGNHLDLYPEHLRQEIDTVNGLVYERVNNGVYRAGFATSQEAYDKAVSEVFGALDTLEKRLARRRYLTGSHVSEADWRLFTTLIRFDTVYHGHFKCNLRRLVDYPNLWGHTRELYQWPGVAETVDLKQIATHYYWSHTSINPTRIIPRGPLLDLEAPHRRDHLPAEPPMERGVLPVDVDRLAEGTKW